MVVEQLRPTNPSGLTPDYAFSARATTIAFEEGERLRQRAVLSGIQEHLNRDSRSLEVFFGEVFSMSESEVPPCSEFVRKPKKTQIIIPGRYPLLVPDIPAEQLARVSGVDAALIERAAMLRSSVWVLVEPNLSPSYPETGKPDSDELFPFAFDIRVYAVYRAFMMHATHEYPDRETRTILDRTNIGGLYPRVGGGEKLEVTTGLSPNIVDIVIDNTVIRNTAIENTGWRVGWTEQREGIWQKA